jgi:hypothetical protein
VLLVRVDLMSDPFQELEELGAPLPFRDHAGQGPIKVKDSEDRNSSVLPGRVNDTSAASSLPQAA